MGAKVVTIKEEVGSRKEDSKIVLDLGVGGRLRSYKCAGYQ